MKIALYRYLVTLIVVGVAVGAGWFLYQKYVTDPWTRDCQVRANVVGIAPRVSGPIINIPVHDNQEVKTGDLLFEIDPADYKTALDSAKASVAKVKFENVEIEEFKPKCFVIMPFAVELENVWGVIRETVEGHDVECERADDEFLSRPILETVKSKIASAEIVIVDFTKKNANVYFEAGLAPARCRNGTTRYLNFSWRLKIAKHRGSGW